MKKKITILCYECKKCNKRVYFQSDTEYDTKCKTCKNEMQFQYENIYRPKNAIKAIKNSNVQNKYNTEFDKLSKVTIKCTYCQSTNVKKIGLFSRTISAELWGLGSKKIGKQWHCNSCGSDF